MNAKIFFTLLVAIAQTARAADADTWQLLPQAQVDGAGIFLDQVVAAPTSSGPLPHLRLARAPSLGQTSSFSRSEISELTQKFGPPGLLATNWAGAAQVHVSRRMRQLDDSELTGFLTATLQSEYVKDLGELELHLTRSTPKIQVPDEPLTLTVTELPKTGVTANFIVTFELWDGKERVGNWQAVTQASVWRDVPVAHSILTRGELLKDADVTMERRDVLALRDAFLNFPPTDNSLEMAETISPGQPILNRAVRVRPLILRGQIVEAVFQDGTLGISLMVETLQDGLLGQTVRVRNPKTKRELFGKVENEKTVRIIL